MTDNGLAALAGLRGIAREAEATLTDNGADRPMTTAALQAKVRLRRAWFEAHPNQPAPEARAEVEALFAAIEAEAIADERARIADAVRGLDGECHDGEGLGCDTYPCVVNVSRAAVLAIVNPEETDHD